MSFAHRERGAKLLSGRGLEIGAMHQPSKVPAHCSVEYLDVASAEVLGASFRELDGQEITRPHYLGDIGRRSVLDITNRTFSFIIMNHVLEHVANPVQVIENVWEAIEENGCLVLSVPDKHFSFDRSRPLTSYEHLLAHYFLEVTEACDDHYADFLAHVHPEVLTSKNAFLDALRSVRERREHVHVWTSTSIREQLLRILGLLKMRASFLFESTASDNGFEYFAVLSKRGEGTWAESAPGETEALPRAGADLQRNPSSPEERMAELEAALQAQQQALAEKDQALRGIQASRAWKLLARYRELRDRYLPERSRRRRLYDRILRNVVP